MKENAPFNHDLPRPWCTRVEAARYLRLSVETVDRLLVPIKEHPKIKPGHIRFDRVGLAQNLDVKKKDQTDGHVPRQITPVRLVSADVLELLPEPSGVVVEYPVPLVPK